MQQSSAQGHGIMVAVEAATMAEMVVAGVVAMAATTEMVGGGGSAPHVLAVCHKRACCLEVTQVLWLLIPWRRGETLGKYHRN